MVEVICINVPCLDCLWSLGELVFRGAPLTWCSLRFAAVSAPVPFPKGTFRIRIQLFVLLPSCNKTTAVQITTATSADRKRAPRTNDTCQNLSFDKCLY